MEKGPEHNPARDAAADRKIAQPKCRTRNVIVFGLICDEGHEFEGWFRSNQDFDDQTSARRVACPACHSTHVEKGIMAPNLNLSDISAPAQNSPYGEALDLTDNEETVASLEAEIALMRRQIKEELRDYVEQNFDNVGTDFPEEARRRHYDGEALGAYGEATVEDMVALIDEGITVAPLPDSRKKLN